MPRNEAQTRRDLIDPVLLSLGWTSDLIKIEVTPGGADIIDGKPKRRKGRSDYLLCLPVIIGYPPLPVAVLEAKKENSPAILGLQQAQTYARRFNVLFAFSTNGKLFSEFGADKGATLTADFFRRMRSDRRRSVKPIQVMKYRMQILMKSILQEILKSSYCLMTAYRACVRICLIFSLKQAVCTRRQ